MKGEKLEIAKIEARLRILELTAKLRDYDYTNTVQCCGIFAQFVINGLPITCIHPWVPKEERTHDGIDRTTDQKYT